MRSQRYHQGATSKRYTVPTSSFFHVDGRARLEMTSPLRNCPILRHLKTAPMAATSSRYVVFSSECPVSVRRTSTSLLGPSTWIFTGDCHCKTPGTVQNIARTEANKMGHHVSLCFVFIVTS